MVRRLPQLSSTPAYVRLAKSDNATVPVRRFSKHRSKHALNSIYISFKLQNNWFICDGLRKRHKDTDSPICQTLFPPPPLRSMRCTKTISLPGIASKSIQQIANRPSGEIGSSVTVSFSVALRIPPSRNLNVDLDILKVSLNRFLL